MQGYNFTDRVRKVLAMAREEAAGLRHEYVGSEHLILAIVRERSGVAATVLRNLGVEGEKLVWRIEETVKRGAPGSVKGPDLPYTSRAKKVLELAMTQARELGTNYVGTEHLLLGLIAEQKGIAAQVLTDAGVTLERARAETMKVLRTEVHDSHDRRESPSTYPTRRPGLAALLPIGASEELKEVMLEAQQAATESGAAQLLPIHLAIALLRRGDGFPNEALERSKGDRPTLIAALTEQAKRSGDG